jgi:uncharacterized membrane protein
MTRCPLPCRTMLVLFLIILGLGSASLAQTFVAFDVPGALDTFPMSINSAGQITGFYMDSINQYRGFRRQPDGVIITFDAPGRGFFTRPMSINSKGEIAGTCNEFAFVRKTNGEIVKFRVPGAFDSEALSINFQGQIAGTYRVDMFSNAVPFLRQPNGSFIRIDAISSLGYYAPSYALSLNSRGQLAGSYCCALTPQDSLGLHGFLRQSDGTIASFDVRGTTGTIARAINGKGQVTGLYFSDAQHHEVHGFLRQTNGSIIKFDVSDSTQTRPMAINERGDVIGTYLALQDGWYHGFLRQANGTIRTFDPLGVMYSTFPTSINERGNVVGYFFSERTRPIHGFIRTQ